MTRNIHPFPKPCLKITLIYSPDTYSKHPVRDFGSPKFMIYVYGFELSGRIWLVCIVTEFRTRFFKIIFVIFHKVECSTSRYFENSQSL
jgi:hypothetical protein